MSKLRETVDGSIHCPNCHAPKGAIKVDEITFNKAKCDLCGWAGEYTACFTVRNEAPRERRKCKCTRRKEAMLQGLDVITSVRVELLQENPNIELLRHQIQTAIHILVEEL